MKKFLFLLFCFIVSLNFTISCPTITTVFANTEINNNISNLEAQGKQFYQDSFYQRSIDIWLEAVNNYSTQGDLISMARVLSNISLAYQQIEEWEKAAQAINQSLNIINKIPQKNSYRVLGQALNTQGSLYFTQGNFEEALNSWKKSESAYEKVNFVNGILQVQLNQVQAMQSLGLYSKSLKILTEITQNMAINCEENNCTQQKNYYFSLISLGKNLRLLGNFTEAKNVLNKALELAKKSEDRENVARSFLGLANLERTQQKRKQALLYYQQALNVNNKKDLELDLQIRLNQLELLIQEEEWYIINNNVIKIKEDLDNLKNSHFKIYYKIKLAENLSLINKKNKSDFKKNDIFSSENIINFLVQTLDEAKKLGDKRAESYTLGNLAQIYQENKQLSIAENITKKALTLAQEINAPEIIYLWQWQLAKISENQGLKEEAINYLSESIKIIDSLSNNLVSLNSDVQFSFRETVEPIYRNLVHLLLDNSDGQITSQENLQKARNVIDSLQIAELNNFFREACLEKKLTKIDDLDRESAIIYPIILNSSEDTSTDSRLEIIVSIPQQGLRQYSQIISSAELEEIINQLTSNLVVRSRRDFFIPANKLYNLVIAPLEEDLQKYKIRNLVFIPDGAFRNIPFAALYDGEKYLLEKYSIANTPSIQLLPSQSLKDINLKTLAVGLTEQRENFSALTYVKTELNAIANKISSVVLIDQDFTSEALREEIEFSNFPIVHIATHGQFSSNLNDTFILAWDRKININQLDSLLETRNINNSQAIELLVLSACETAAGDKRAALGLAGIAVKAGAKSTVATFWAVNDEATAKLMSEFYEQLISKKVSKAEALRQAQLSLLKDTAFEHPFYWAPYILVGNWL